MDASQLMQYDAGKKSQGVAFGLWWLLGIFGAHRFYLGYTKSAIAMLVLTISLVGIPVMIVWYIVDLFLIWGMATRHNTALIERVTLGVES